MILKAYIDESGTHGGSPVTIMAGYVAAQEQWALLEKEWNFLLQMHGLTHFHAVDLLQSKGPFKKWKLDRKAQLTEALENLCIAHARFGFGTRMANDDYDRIFIAGSKPRKAQLDSRYGVCFRLSLFFIAKMTRELFTTNDVALHVILEDGHKNAGDAQRLYDLFKKQADPQLTRIVSSLSFANKACVPLQAADIIAYPIFRGEARGEQDYFDIPRGDDGWTAAREFAKHHKAPIFRLVASATMLADLRRDLQSA